MPFYFGETFKRISPEDCTGGHTGRLEKWICVLANLRHKASVQKVEFFNRTVCQNSAACKIEAYGAPEVAALTLKFYHDHGNYGSELHPPNILQNLLPHHRNWLLLAKQLSKGSIWPLSSHTEYDCISKNFHFIRFGQSLVCHILALCSEIHYHPRGQPE